MPIRPPFPTRRAVLTTIGTVALSGCSATNARNERSTATAGDGTSPEDTRNPSRESTTTEESTDISGDTTGWPQVGRFATHAGANPDASGSVEPSPSWTKQVDGMLTTPTIANGSLYVTHGVPGADGLRAVLESYAVDTGEREWTLPLHQRFEYNAPLSNHRPIVHGNRVYVTGTDRLLAIDAESRKVLWTVAFDAFFNWPATVTDRSVYVVAQDALHCLTHDGTLRWQESIGDTLCYLAAVDDESVYTFDEGALTSRDVATGVERWRTPFGGDSDSDSGISGTIPVVGHDVVVRSAGPLTESVSVDGTTRWRVTSSDHTATLRPVIGVESVFVTTIEGSVTAYDRSSGERRWRRDVGDGNWTQETAPILVDGALCVPQSNGEQVHVYGLDPASGEQRWVRSAPGARIRGPVATAGHLVVTTQNRHRPGEPPRNSTATPEPVRGTIRVFEWNE